jgi:hypothetical protein
MADYKPLICNQCLLQEDDALCKLSYQGWYLITGNLIRTNNFIILNIINKAPTKREQDDYSRVEGRKEGVRWLQ